MNYLEPRKVKVSIRHVMALARIVLALTVVTIWLDIAHARQILGLLSLFVIPGLIVIFLFGIACRDYWEYTILVFGISLSFLMFVGLLLNQAFRALDVRSPLASTPVLATVVACCFIGSELAMRLRSIEWVYLIDLRVARSSWRLYLLPALFPILGVTGAISLNVGAGSQIAVVSVILISVFVIILTWAHSHFSSSLLAWSVFMIGMAMLLSMSLRSWHVSGWDINQEFYVYQLTQTNQEWRIEAFRDPYNACLSITVLPTVINAFLGVNDEYVFKLIYQLIFAAVPLTVFLTARKYLSSILSFFASLFFVFQPWFIQPLPALARQQIGLFFFALLVWVTFHGSLTLRQRNALLLVFGASLVVSHYSTAYIGLGTLTLTLICSLALKRAASTPRLWGYRSLNSAWVLLVLYTLAFYWSNIFTETSGNVSYVARNTLQNMRYILRSDLRSEDVRLSLGLVDSGFGISDVHAYVLDQTAFYASRPGLYSPGAYSDYMPQVMTSAKLAPLSGNQVLERLLAVPFPVIRQLTKVLLILGALVLVHHVFRARGFDPEYGILNMTSIAILVVFIALPVLSLYYNLFRIYVQTLVVSSVSLVIGANYPLSFVSRPRVRIKLLGTLLVVFFISSSGIAAYIVGGAATMNLNNFGEDFDKFYTHEQEVYGARWLSARRVLGPSIYADQTASLRLISFGPGIVNTESAVLPSTITRESYVYLSYANVHVGITEARFKGMQISYEYPKEFVSNTKNLIYNNGGAQVYR